MEELPPLDKNDLVQQTYKGPGAIAAGLGEGALQTKYMTIAGITLGGLGAFIFHNQTTPWIKKFYVELENLASSPKGWSKNIAKGANWALDFGRGSVTFLKEFTFVQKIGEMFSPETQRKFSNAADGAIIASTGLSFAGFFTGLFSGVSASHRGRQQFESAKSEISSLRTELIATQEQLNHMQIVATETAHNTTASNLSRHEHVSFAERHKPHVPITNHAPRGQEWASDVAAQKKEAPDAARG